MPRVRPAVKQRLPRGSLDRDRIMAAAWKLCGDGDLRQLSMQRVAAELEVRPSAVHWHFPRKQLLIDALYDEAVRRFNQKLPATDDQEEWHEQLRQYWEQYRAILRADPILCDLIVGEWTAVARVPDALSRTYRRIDTQLGTMIAAGFTPEAAARSYHLLSTYTRGCLLNERKAAHDGQLVTRPKSRATSMGVDLSWLPHLQAAAPYWSFTFATDEDFTFGLQTIITGLRTTLADTQRTSRSRRGRGAATAR
jgi:TetR/AcrR family tetracycline transcriptional repressor